MKILIVKTSSLGDILHTFPALTDAGRVIPNIQFDWVVEENFQEVPAWHPLVNKVIPLALRRWRKQPFPSLFSREWWSFLQNLRQTQYDKVIDAQGLIKSALVTRLSRGSKMGLDKASLWESLARFAYHEHYAVNPELHAVTRVRQLFALTLGYTINHDILDYGLDSSRFTQDYWQGGDYLVFLHGTTWVTKHWPEQYWMELAKIAAAKGLQIRIPWGNAEEEARAQRIAQNCNAVQIIPHMDLSGIASILVKARAIIAVDTGLGHLAAALAVPTISLYGPTDPNQTGTRGRNQLHLAANFVCAPCLQKICTYTKPSAVKPACFGTIPPQLVWEKVEILLQENSNAKK